MGRESNAIKPEPNILAGRDCPVCLAARPVPTLPVFGYILSGVSYDANKYFELERPGKRATQPQQFMFLIVLRNSMRQQVKKRKG